jgi:mannitol 2-dehydrogenase
VPGIDLTRYKAELIGRFASPAVRDTLARICAEASDRIPKFLLPVIRDNLASGGEVRRSIAVLAAWARSAEGTDEQGRPLEIVDPLRDRLVAAAARQREDPLAFVADRDLFGDLVDDARFVELYRATLGSLHIHGVRATLEALIGPGAAIEGFGA